MADLGFYNFAIFADIMSYSPYISLTGLNDECTEKDKETFYFLSIARQAYQIYASTKGTKRLTHDITVSVNSLLLALAMVSDDWRSAVEG